MKQDRRSFFKSFTGLFAGAVVAPAILKSVPTKEELPDYCYETFSATCIPATPDDVIAKIKIDPVDDIRTCSLDCTCDEDRKKREMDYDWYEYFNATP